MKKRKADTKKSLKKQDKKDLQSNITQRFLDAVSNLGHDADRIAKDLKKIGKQLAEKLSKLDKAKPKKAVSKKAVEVPLAKEEKSAKKSPGRARAEKVVAKVVSRKPQTGKTPTEKPVEKVQSVEVPEVKQPVTRVRRKASDASPAENGTGKPAARRGRKPASDASNTEAKPVTKRGPRKKIVPPASENIGETAENDPVDPA